MQHTLGPNVAKTTEMAISVVTFDLDNTLWDVEPAIIRAEEAQQQWLRQHRPGATETFDDDALFEFKKSVWKRHPQLTHHVSQMRTQMLYELQTAAGYSEEDARSGADQAFAVFLRERHAVERGRADRVVVVVDHHRDDSGRRYECTQRDQHEECRLALFHHRVVAVRHRPGDGGRGQAPRGEDQGPSQLMHDWW